MKPHIALIHAFCVTAGFTVASASAIQCIDAVQKDHAMLAVVLTIVTMIMGGIGQNSLNVFARIALDSKEKKP